MREERGVRQREKVYVLERRNGEKVQSVREG